MDDLIGFLFEKFEPQHQHLYHQYDGVEAGASSSLQKVIVRAIFVHTDDSTEYEYGKTDREKQEREYYSKERIEVLVKFIVPLYRFVIENFCSCL